MYKMYDEYKEALKKAKAALRKRQKINAKIRDKYEKPYARHDYNANKRDITLWNSMIRDLEEDLKMIEMYLDFDDRYYLHKEYNNMKSMILNKNSYEGEVPIKNLYGTSTPDTTEIIFDVEMQEEIVELLDDVLTERQRQVVQMYFFENMTQERIAKELGISREAVKLYLANSLKKLRNNVKTISFSDF